MRVIHSPDDPAVQLFTAVRDGDLLRQHGLFVAESRHVVERALVSGQYACRGLFVTPAASSHLSSRCCLDHVPVFIASAAVMAEVSGYSVHQGALALFERPLPTPLARLLFATPHTLLVLDSVADPANVGAIFRTAAALGAGGAALCGTSADPLYRRAIRAAMGATLSLPFARVADPPPAIAHQLREAGYALVGLSPREDALDIAAMPPGRAALVLGNEGHGLSASWLAAVDMVAAIPMASHVDSLNVAAAAAIALYARAAQPAKGTSEPD